MYGLDLNKMRKKKNEEETEEWRIWREEKEEWRGRCRFRFLPRGGWRGPGALKLKAYILKIVIQTPSSRESLSGEKCAPAPAPAPASALLCSSPFSILPMHRRIGAPPYIVYRRIQMYPTRSIVCSKSDFLIIFDKTSAMTLLFGIYEIGWLNQTMYCSFLFFFFKWLQMGQT